MKRPEPRVVKGFRDLLAADLLRKRCLIESIRRVYERYGFVPLETPALEFVDVLGKFLPEAHTPEGGIFAFPNRDLEAGADPRDPDYWVALRYDLTAPLARVVAQYRELPRPFRRYQLGTVWRYEKPGPGRFREFLQFDFDSVGVPEVTADAEAAAVMCDTFEALGFGRGQYLVKVNDRKLMQGVLEICGLGRTALSDESSQAAAILRSIDKLDRLGMDGVCQLLGEGRMDETGDFTPGAGLDARQVERVVGFLGAQVAERREAVERLEALVSESEAGREGIAELRLIDATLESLGYGSDQVRFDPTVIRGLSYYTGPVFEGGLTVPLEDAEGRERRFGTLIAGGRYDDLVERFSGEKVPATGASVGVDRLLEAVKVLESGERPRATSQVLVTVMDKQHLDRYFRIARRLREAGINAEVFLGSGRIGRQLKYADQAGIPFAVIAGGDEFSRGEVQLKDLKAGLVESRAIAGHEEWREKRVAQRAVPEGELVELVRGLLGPAPGAP